MKYGSLFSGVGGFDMGFDNAGYDCRWQVEWDKHCQQTLAHHWPDVPKHGDVQDVSGYNLEPVDVITYGSPCQDLSVGGRRAGIEGGRSSMFFESVRIFKEMRDATGGIFPRVVVWENVPGALTSNKGRDFGSVLTSLDDIGAVAQWWNVLDAQYFGVPQRRRRVFLVSVFDPAIAGRAGTGQILSVSKGRRRNHAASRPTREIVAALTANGVGTCGADDNQSNANVFEDVLPTLKASQQAPSVFPIQGTIIGRQDHNGPGGPGFGQEGDPMYTLDTVSQHGVATPTIVRRLTPIECERLMGWPDNHTLHRADGKTNRDSTRYKMCGNGVATPVAQWIATQLKELL